MHPCGNAPDWPAVPGPRVALSQNSRQSLCSWAEEDNWHLVCNHEINTQLNAMLVSYHCMHQTGTRLVRCVFWMNMQRGKPVLKPVLTSWMAVMTTCCTDSSKVMMIWMYSGDATIESCYKPAHTPLALVFHASLFPRWVCYWASLIP